MTQQLADLMLDQWRETTRLRGIVTDIIQPIQDDALAAAARLELMQDVDEAVGVWLDRIGKKVGIIRPEITDPALDPRFGFDQAGRGFDQVPFRGAMANDAVFPMPDSVFRRLVKARAITVLGDGTAQTFRQAVLQVDPGATVVDNRNMTLTVTTTQQAILEVADSIGAMPRTAGVDVIYA